MECKDNWNFCLFKIRLILQTKRSETLFIPHSRVIINHTHKSAVRSGCQSQIYNRCQLAE